MFQVRGQSEKGALLLTNKLNPSILKSWVALVNNRQLESHSCYVHKIILWFTESAQIHLALF